MKKQQDQNKLVCPEYDTLVEGLVKARAAVAEAGKGAVGALFKAFFTEHPFIKAIGWAQYTPYYSDGDPCEFDVREFYVCTKGDVDFSEVTRLHDEEIFLDSYSVEDASTKEALRLIERSKSDEIFKEAFGDHVMVIATPSGFHVNEYSHD